GLCLGLRLSLTLGRLALAAFAVAAGLAVLLDDREFGADLDRLVGLDLDGLQDPGDRGGDLGVDLVGRHLEQGVGALDPVALLLDPAGDRALGDRLAELRHLDWCRHWPRLPAQSWWKRRPARVRWASPTASDRVGWGWMYWATSIGRASQL